MECSSRCWRWISGRTVLITLLVAGAAGCSPDPGPDRGPAAANVPTAGFDHAALADVLRRFVDADSRVDYAGLRADPGSLQLYVASLAETSPDSRPGRFHGEADRLAYWINAYNALVIEGLTRYPGARSPLAILPDAGFFRQLTFTLGGEAMTLDHLENVILRGRFHDPRLHFALVCGARSCPKLWPEPYSAEKLDRQLDLAARLFFAQPDNLEFVPDSRTIRVSRYLDWYSDDFRSWIREHPATLPAAGEDGAPVSYALNYTLPARSRQLRTALDGGWSVAYSVYDWTLNDQALDDSQSWHPPASDDASAIRP
ncbi:MAG: DUF547 domain-containing protein [Acidobacteriota bacterium]